MKALITEVKFETNKMILTVEVTETHSYNPHTDKLEKLNTPITSNEMLELLTYYPLSKYEQGDRNDVMCIDENLIYPAWYNWSNEHIIGEYLRTH